MASLAFIQKYKKSAQNSLQFAEKLIQRRQLTFTWKYQKVLQPQKKNSPRIAMSTVNTSVLSSTFRKRFSKNII